jgi:hypothetical protein
MPGMETPQIDAAANVSAEVAVFPNPAADRIQIAGLDASDIMSLEVYDATGRAVVRAQNIAIIDLSALKDGVYSLRVISPQGVFATSLLVSKK